MDKNQSQSKSQPAYSIENSIRNIQFSKETNQECDEEKEKKKNQLNLFFIIYMISFNLAAALTSGIKYSNNNYAIIAGVAALLSMALYFFVKILKNQIVLQIIICSIILLSVIGLCEGLIMYAKNNFILNNNYFMFGISVALFTSVSLNFLQNIVLKFILLFGILEYCIIRINQVESFIYFSVHLSVIAINIFIYLNQPIVPKNIIKQSEIDLLKQQKQTLQQKIQKQIKELLDLVLPGSVFIFNFYDAVTQKIIKDKNINLFFANKNCKDMFKFQDVNQLVHNLNKIFYIQKEEKIRDSQPLIPKEYFNLEKNSIDPQKANLILGSLSLSQSINSNSQQQQGPPQIKRKPQNERYIHNKNSIMMNRSQNASSNFIQNQNAGKVLVHSRYMDEINLETPRRLDKLQQSQQPQQLSQHMSNLGLDQIQQSLPDAPEDEIHKDEDKNIKYQSLFKFLEQHCRQIFIESKQHKHYNNNNIQFSDCEQGNTYFTKKSQIFMKCFSEKKPDQLRFYDIQILECEWENQSAIMVHINDLTKEVLHERVSALSQYKDQLLASVSHDLRTPLSSMLLFIDMAKNQNDLKSTKDNLTRAENTGTMLLAMINDILDYAQINQGKLRLVPEIFSVEKCVRDIYNIMEFQAEQKQLFLDVKINLNPDQDKTVINDIIRIKQVLLNLVTNAIKFTQTGGITISIETDNLRSNSLKFSVRDTGIGIPPNIKEKLFTPFATFDQNSCNKHGVGLGLTICKKIVAQIGPHDSIDLESEIGKGSLFSFFIYKNLYQVQSQRLEESKLQKKRQMYQELSKQLNQLSDDRMEDTDEKQSEDTNRIMIPIVEIKKNILSISQPWLEQNNLLTTSRLYNFLLVDDNVFNIVVLKNILTIRYGTGFQSFVAYDGLQAVQLYQTQKNNQITIDAVFMDMSMPNMNGLDATKQIRLYEQQYKFQPTLIIMLTGYHSTKEYLQECHDAGANKFLQKPFKREELDEILDNYEI